MVRSGDYVLLVWTVFGLALLFIGVGDFLFFRIENEYVLFLMTLYVISCIGGVSGENFTVGLTTAVVVFVVTLIFNRLDWIGGGDVKLLFPVILFSENNLVTFLMGMAMGGIFLVVLYSIFHRHIFLIRKRLVKYLCSLRKKRNKSYFLTLALPSLDRINKRAVVAEKYCPQAMRQEIPYGVAISCGGLCVILENLVAGW